MNFLCRHGWHKFKPRYMEHPNGKISSVEDKGFHGNMFAFEAYLKYMDKMRDMMLYKEYIYDICERCGETRKV